ncbi:MAG TPA: hypothetical protein VMG08_17655 [Allosphingosinicella sp.]|nr:hypothetical protein [Allosphingosinicella sp.]
MRGLLALLGLIMAGAGEARARAVDDATFCTTLRRLLAAANERPAFASLGRSGPARAAAGLGFDRCRIEAALHGNRLVCLRQAPGPAPQARIARCVPEALRMMQPRNSATARFRLGTLAFHVEPGRETIVFRLFALPVER